MFKKMENISFALYICMMSVLSILQPEFRPFTICLVLLTVIPLVVKLILPENSELEDFVEKYSDMLTNFKYSSLIFVFGIYFVVFSDFTILSENNWYSYLTASTVIIIFFVLAIGYSTIIKDVEKEKYREIMQDGINQIKNRSGIKGLNELLETIESKEANVLLVAGNLLSMNTEKGIELLNTFLKKSGTNKLKLIIPQDSKKYLADIKKKIPKYFHQIEGFICEPFWFLQGIVIIGKIPKPPRKNAITPIGCFYYKTKYSKDEVISNEGIFIETGSDINTNFAQAVCAYYFLMNTFEYSQNQYEVKQVFWDISNNKKPEIHNPKIEIIDWGKIL